MLTRRLCAGNGFEMDTVTALFGMVFTNDKEGDLQVEDVMVTICKDCIPLKLCNVVEHIVV